jgi:hypothetical protein
MTDTPRIIPLINDYLESLNLEPDGRVEGVIHCSELSWCLRSVYYCRLKAPKRHCIKPSTRRTFDTGHAVHEWLGKYMDGCPPAIDLEVACGLDDPPMFGHIDGIWCRPGEFDVGLEFKTMKTEKYTRPPISGSSMGGNRPLEGHLIQIHCYMKCTGLRHFIVLYWNKNDGRLKEFFIEYDEDIMRKVDERIDIVENAVELGEPPEGMVGRWSCPECRFCHICDEKGVDAWRKKE